MREITPHPEIQRSYAELREEFRAEALSNLRRQFTSHHQLGWSMVGDPSESRARFTAENWAREMLNRLDAPVSQDFGLSDVPFTVSIKLEDQSQKALLHESVTWDDSVEGVRDSDAPPMRDPSTLSDEELCDYVEAAIARSREREA